MVEVSIRKKDKTPVMTLTVNGVDISHCATSAVLVCEAGEQPRLLVKMIPDSIDISALCQIEEVSEDA